jgi:TonB family protein
MGERALSPEDLAQLQKQRIEIGRYFTYAPSPDYPLPALRRGRNGVTFVRISSDGAGNVTNVTLVQSSGHRDLDGEVLRTVKRWKVRPTAPREITLPFKFYIRAPKAAADGRGLMMTRGIPPADPSRHP